MPEVLAWLKSRLIWQIIGNEGLRLNKNITMDPTKIVKFSYTLGP